MNAGLPLALAQALAPFAPPQSTIHRVLDSPRFPKTYCSQCGEEFGPANHGFSHCTDHKARSWHVQNDVAAMALQIKSSPQQ